MILWRWVGRLVLDWLLGPASWEDYDAERLRPSPMPRSSH
jgi:hypothetical protein